MAFFAFLLVALFCTLLTTAALGLWARRKGILTRGFVLRAAIFESVWACTQFLVLLMLLAKHGNGPGQISQEDPPDAPGAVGLPNPIATPLLASGYTDGYSSGFALATNLNHRHAPLPTARALDAVTDVHCRGKPEGFRAGFKNGYLAGSHEARDQDSSSGL